MNKYKIQVISTQYFEVEVEAEDEVSAYAELDDWNSDDFEDFQTGATWEFEIIEEEETQDGARNQN